MQIPKVTNDPACRIKGAVNVEANVFLGKLNHEPNLKSVITYTDLTNAS